MLEEKVKECSSREKRSVVVILHPLMVYIPLFRLPISFLCSTILRPGREKRVEEEKGFPSTVNGENCLSRFHSREREVRGRKLLLTHFSEIYTSSPLRTMVEENRTSLSSPLFHRRPYRSLSRTNRNTRSIGRAKTSTIFSPSPL